MLFATQSFNLAMTRSYRIVSVLRMYGFVCESYVSPNSFGRNFGHTSSKSGREVFRSSFSNGTCGGLKFRVESKLKSPTSNASEKPARTWAQRCNWRTRHLWLLSDSKCTEPTAKSGSLATTNFRPIRDSNSYEVKLAAKSGRVMINTPYPWLTAKPSKPEWPHVGNAAISESATYGTTSCKHTTCGFSTWMSLMSACVRSCMRSFANQTFRVRTDSMDTASKRPDCLGRYGRRVRP
mmetsp:Transcript_22110/g.66058  ORF Transcript_22110/g.66058 Transcript_22110/m.66058 type:complete len:237 (-) Transcript_22110:27-737(-)